MDTVTLKSKYGPTGFTCRTRIENERGYVYEEPVRYDFSLDNDCKCKVPLDVWATMEEQWFDRTFGLKYRDAFISL